MKFFRTVEILSLLGLVTSIPMQLTINQRATECLYEELAQGESVTMSVFLLAGSELKASAFMEGPIARSKINSGVELQNDINDFEKGVRFGEFTRTEEIIDMEHMMADAEIEEELMEEDDDENFTEGLDDDDAFNDEDAEGDQAEKARKRMEERRRRAQLARQKARDARRKREQRRREHASKMRQEGEPIQNTLVAKAPGWYRACVKASWFQVVTELEMRKSSELGGIDQDTGHVFTYEKQLENDEEKILDEDTAAEEDGIDEKDFEQTRDMLRKLRRLLSDIQAKQQVERHRLLVHAATNEHSHSRMVVGSLLQSLMFMLVTGYQVYTIRKWFSNAQLLGR